LSTVLENYEEESDVELAESRRSGYAVSSDRRILAAYPGQVIHFNVNVRGPPKHSVAIVVEGLPSHVATTIIAPDKGVAPYVARAEIRVNPGALAGLYPLDIVIHDLTLGNLLGRERLALLVLRRDIPISFAKKYHKLTTIYTKQGAMWLIWYLLKEVFADGATFSQLKATYELVKGDEVSNGTIGNILKRMVRKRIIYKDRSGVYRLLVDDPVVVDSRIDESRAHVSTLKSIVHQESSKEPYSARLAFQRALKIKQKHGVLPALHFLVHSVIGARMTGYLLYWYNDWFVVCEGKTGFCHHFYSPYISQMLRKLGVVEGIQHRNTSEWQKARRIAYKYIHKYYKSFANARRVHYKVKQYKLIEYDGEIYVIEIIHYIDGDIGLRIWDERKEEILHEDNIEEDKEIAYVEVKTAYPREHEDEKNEDTYFSRPSGLY